MDWKDILSQKVADGELDREDFTPAADEPQKTEPLIEVILDNKGRKGKSATIAFGFDCDDNTLKEIASQIKSKLSTGGSARGGEILIQGDHREQMKQLLKGMGYKLK